MLVCLTLIACSKKSKEIVIENQTNKRYFVFISESDYILDGEIYHNSIKNNQIDEKLHFKFYTDSTHRKVIIDEPGNWDEYFKNISDKKLRLFIVPTDTVEKYGWSDIYQGYGYVKYKLSKEDLDFQKWKIVIK